MTSAAVRSHTFPVGYFDLHPDISINFQMNRFYNWSNDPEMLAEMRAVASQISTYEGYIRTFLSLAEKALAAGRRLTAAFYIRGAEFYMAAGNPEKKPARERFIALMHEHYQIDRSELHLVPYEGGNLPSYRFTATDPRGTILLFGGFDTYIEELFGMCFLLVSQGFDVICFEGPGQGGALEDWNLPLTHEWEKPVKAVLDYFDARDVTALGLSLGGYFAVRAAAFDQRIKRVVADDVCYDFAPILLAKIPPSLRGTFKALLLNGGGAAINFLFRRIMKRDLLMNWAGTQGMHITGTQSPYAFLRKMLMCNSIETSHLLVQDVLLLAAMEDHYIPGPQLTDQIKALKNVRSLTTRTFSRADQAQNHCHVGNVQIALDVIVDWIVRTQALYGDAKHTPAKSS